MLGMGNAQPRTIGLYLMEGRRSPGGVRKKQECPREGEREIRDQVELELLVLRL